MHGHFVAAAEIHHIGDAEPTTIFRASEAPWSKEMNSIGEATFGLKMPGWATDGPQLFKTRTGKPENA